MPIHMAARGTLEATDIFPIRLPNNPIKLS